MAACRATSPSSLPRAYLIGRPAVCCRVALPVCPCVVSFSKVHGHDTHDLLRTSSRGSSRGCHENVTRQLVSWNFSLMETRCCSNVGDSPFVAAEHESFNRISQMAPICTCPYVNSLFLGPTPVCSKQYLDQFSRSIGLTFTKLQNLIANIGCIFQTRVYIKRFQDS